MSDYPKTLPVPMALVYYQSGIRVITRAGDKSSESNSGVGESIALPKGFECKPLVTVQAYGADRVDVGPCWCFDWEADQGRGVWVTYDPSLHKVPKLIDESESLPDADPSDHVAHLESPAEEYESESTCAPYVDETPDCDHEDCECDEPSDDAADADLDDDDGEEIAG